MKCASTVLWQWGQLAETVLPSQSQAFLCTKTGAYIQIPFSRGPTIMPTPELCPGILWEWAKKAGTALKEYTQCIQKPKNTTRCCLIYKDGHNLRVLKSQMSFKSDRRGWPKHREVQVVYMYRRATTSTFTPTCCSISIVPFNQKKN